MSDQESDFPTLRTDAASRPAAEPLSTPYGVNEAVELVIDLLAATRLVPEDKLAMARGRAKHTRSLGDALVEEGVASSDGIARMLAARHQLPLVDLQLLELDVTAAREVPLHVLERVVAIPYAYGDGTLRIAVADPANLHGIDELRLATKQTLELGVASRDDILTAIRKLVRASEAFGARATVLEEEELLGEISVEDEDSTD